ncbi:MAG: hypothetical protein PUB96_03715 [Helicobacteraceae bacterium]|nr:hypothetical protein [Helicobacteraceae bacterium]
MRVFKGFLEAAFCIFALFYLILLCENKVIFGIFISLELLYDYSGYFCLAFLVFGLFLKPPFGKLCGILAFICGILHCLIFIFLDFGLNFTQMVQKVTNEPPLIYGLISIIFMIFVWCVSVAQAFRILSFSKILVYLTLLFALIHIISLQKVLSPFYYFLIIALILLCILKMFKGKIYKCFIKNN